MKVPRDATPGAPLDLVLQAPAIVREDLAALAAITGCESTLPIEGTAAEAYRLSDIESTAGVAEACDASGYDGAFVPQARDG